MTIKSSETENSQYMDRKKPSVKTAPHVLFLGSFPPRKCGLATFLQDLTEHYEGPYSVVAIDEPTVEALNRNYSDKVIYRLNQTNRDAYYAVADIINSRPYDIINVQHEFSLFGGMMGEYIVHLLTSVRKPVITTFHT